MAPNKQTYLTPEGRKKLEDELEYLRTIRRKDVAELIASAKEEGDISENAAYDEAKNQQAFLEGRIQDIKRILNNAITIDETDRPAGVVAIGSRVTVVEDGYDEEETFRIVGSAEADPGQGFISNVSPIGKALLGHRAGERVSVNTPGGVLTFEVREIA
ncbi:MAG: transcription elongation factor GreA [Anaerolineae bacterium]